MDHEDDASVQAALPTNYFDAAVMEYYVVGNGNSYDKHVYSICVSADGLQFTVERTYVDFVDLDRKLRKKFPRIRFPTLPLEASAVVAKILAKEAGRLEKVKTEKTRRNSLGSGISPIKQPLRESMTTGKDEIASQFSKGLRLIEGDRITDDKVAALNKYLKQILTLHEVLASDEILLFLDEEASSMSIDPNTLEPISAHDLLLINEPITTVTVSRIEDVIFQVRPGQLVVWRFSTDKYDIGFSIEMCGEIKVSYTRYNSHIRPAMGTVEAQSAGFCNLKWDNSYAKFRSKQLHWSARVVSADEFHTAKLQALEVQREKKKFQIQRWTLKRVCIRNAAKYSGVIHSTDVVHEHAEEEGMHIRDMEDEITRLQQEVEGLHADLETSLEDLEQLEIAKSAADESRDQISGSWKFTATQLDNAQNELKMLRKELTESADIKKEMKFEIERLRKELRVAQDLIAFNEEAEKQSATTCMQALEEADNKILLLEEQLLNEKEEWESRRIKDISSSKENAEASLRSIITSQQNELAHLTKQVNELQQTNLHMEELHGEGVKVLSDECNQQKNIIIGLNAELGEFRGSTERLRSQIVELEQVIAQHVQFSSTAHPNTTSVENDLAILLSQLTNERESCENLRIEVANRNHDVERLSIDLVEAHDANTVLSVQLSNTKKSEASLTLSLEQCRTELEQLSEEKAFVELSSQERIGSMQMLLNESTIAATLVNEHNHKLQEELLVCQDQLNKAKTLCVDSVHAQSVAESQSQAQAASLEETRTKVSELERQLLTAGQQAHLDAAATIEQAKEKWVLERLQLEKEWDRNTQEKLSNQISVLLAQHQELLEVERLKFQEELMKYKQDRNANDEKTESSNKINAEILNQELHNQLLQDNSIWRESTLETLRKELEDEYRKKYEDWKLAETARIEAKISLSNQISDTSSASAQLTPTKGSVAVNLSSTKQHRFPLLDDSNTDASRNEHDLPVVASPSVAVTTTMTKTPPRFTELNASTSTSTSTASECIRLATILKAKEGQLTVTMQLYDEQTLLVADLTAEVSSLKEQLEEQSTEQKEKMHRLECAMSEISSSVAYWLS